MMGSKGVVLGAVLRKEHERERQKRPLCKV